MSSRTRSTWALLAIAIGGTACGDRTSPSDLAGPPSPSFGVELACHGVSGTAVATFLGADLPNNLFFFGGPVSGDLIGTIFSAVTGPGDAPGDPPSPINGGLGAHTMEVSGGSIEALVGATLVFESDEVNRQDPPLALSQSRWTLIDGARGGHLTMHGSFDFTTFVSTSEYKGSVCP